LSELSEKTKLPSILDVVATSPEAMRKYLTYLIDETRFPLLIDGSASLEVNLAGIEAAEAGGYLDRVAVNSLTLDTSPILYETAQDKGLRNAVVLTFSVAAVTSVKGRVDMASQIVSKAGTAGISNLMIDTGVIDPPTLGIACAAQHVIKDRFGLPVGCGAHNAVSTWKGFTKKFGKPGRLSGVLSSVTMPIALGGDFVLYGPVQHASEVYPAIHLVDKALSGLRLVSE
jgi:tetrahydromethanopterin S-methyltransferase subunit H